MTSATSVKNNLISVEDRIRAACSRSGRSREDVLLVSVTKTKPIPMLQEAYDCGQRNFGENKVQEITRKSPLLPEDIRWHMIGHLQKNKVKYLMDGRIAMIHSVDSADLALEISKRAVQAGIVMPVLIEVNAAGEASKFGVAPDACENLVRTIAPLEGIRVRGLMTSAPYTENAETNRPYFRLLRELAVDIQSKSIDNVNINALSMGMSGDFEVAIEEGATIVRIGTSIFGERDYSAMNA